MNKMTVNRPSFISGPRIRWQVNLDQTVTEIHKIKVHEFSMGDVEDSELYLDMAIREWSETDKGRFVESRKYSPLEILRTSDLLYWGHRYAIIAELDIKSLSEYYLRWGDEQKGK